MNKKVNALTIAGTDSGCSAGAATDILTFANIGVYPNMAITCLTAQNPEKVALVEKVSPEFLSSQIKTLDEYFDIKAVKTGMLFNEQIVEKIVDFCESGFFANKKLVVDPVMISTSKAVLLNEKAIKLIDEKFLKYANLITPNLDEASFLLNKNCNNVEDMKKSAKELSKRYNTNVLLKGGHLCTEELVDVLCLKDMQILLFTNKAKQINTHGSGCILSAAITAYLSLGFDEQAATKKGIDYLQNAIQNSVFVGKDRFINNGRYSI